MIWPEAIYLLVLPISYYAGIITNNPNALIIAMVLYEIFVCTIRVWIASKVSIIQINELLASIIYMQNNYIVYSTDYFGVNLDSLFKQYFIKFDYYSYWIKQTRKKYDK